MGQRKDRIHPHLVVEGGRSLSVAFVPLILSSWGLSGSGACLGDHNGLVELGEH